MKEPRYYTRAILTEILPKYCVGVVADIGAGRGKYRPLIMRYSRKYIALDNLSSSFQFGRDESKAQLDVIGGVAQLPFVDGAFDTVVCTEVIEHVEDPFALMVELNRILAPGGHLILSTGWIAPYHPEPKDYYRFSHDAFRYLFVRFGFEVVELIPKGGLFTLLLYFPLRLLDLHSALFRRVKGKAIVLFRALEFACQWLDSRFGQTEDTVGYVGVGRKR